MRFASILRPRYLFLENVEGLLNHEGGDTFETILRTLDEVGYDAEWHVLNSKDFGVPQNRERVFIIGHLRGERTRKIFPFERTDGQTSLPVKIVAHRDGYRRNTQTFSPDGITETLDTGQGGGRGHHVIVMGNVNPSGNGMNGNVFNSDALSPTLTTNKGEGPKVVVRAVLTPNREEKRQNGRRIKEPDEPMFTLTAQDRHGVAIKKLGHLERDTGNTGIIYDPEGIAPTQLAQHGNAVTKIIDVYTVIQKTHGATTTIKHNETGTLQAARLDKLPNIVIEPYRIRKLTPRECWRLQGFPDWAFDRAKDAGVSDSQLYKQAGNSVTVIVIYEIAICLE